MDKLVERESAPRNPLVAAPALAVQFFLIPLAVVDITVLVYAGFRSLLSDDRTPNEEAWRTIVALSAEWKMDPPRLLVCARIFLQQVELQKLVSTVGEEQVNAVIREMGPAMLEALRKAHADPELNKPDRYA